MPERVSCCIVLGFQRVLRNVLAEHYPLNVTAFGPAPPCARPLGDERRRSTRARGNASPPTPDPLRDPSPRWRGRCGAARRRSIPLCRIFTTLGSEEGGSDETGTRRSQESRCQKGSEEVGFGHCSTHRGVGISADAGSRSTITAPAGDRRPPTPPGAGSPWESFALVAESSAFPKTVTCDKSVVQRGHFCTNTLDALQ